MEIAFEGGAIVSALVEISAAEQLEQALAGGHEGSFTLETQDGNYQLALRKVVYVKRFARESRLGFGDV
jgi:hypothetical protein